EYDPETGLYHYRTRYYDPSIGRFITRDRIGLWGDRGGLGNAQAYGGNNPFSMVDPYGLDVKDWVYTGYWNPPPGVTDAARDEFSQSNSDRTNGTLDAVAENYTFGIVGSVGGTTFDEENRAGAASAASGIIQTAEYVSGVGGALKGLGKAGAKGALKASVVSLNWAWLSKSEPRP
ncbi:MAG: RHS repeat-associated core domain-containing protein, partial [Planctomycetota bacterium]